MNRERGQKHIYLSFMKNGASTLFSNTLSWPYAEIFVCGNGLMVKTCAADPKPPFTIQYMEFQGIRFR